ncbi:MAG TPA: YidB family protein [Tepidisphaeraceae bacterium]|jgi:uncharacterized protein YidB (DUF937 family)
MGLLDQILGAATGGQAAGPSPAPQTALQGVLNLINSPQVGGVGGLVKLFQSNGMGNLADGWVGRGPNPGVSPQQVSQVFGQDRLGEFAQHLGVPPQQASQHLSQMLPHVVDHMTPDGSIPTTPTSGAAVFDMLKSKLLGG